MPTFQILDDGELFATAIAPSIDSPAWSIEGGESFYAGYTGLIAEGEKYLSPGQYAALLGGNGSGSVREVDADEQLVANEEPEAAVAVIYIACIEVWCHRDRSFGNVPVAVLSVHAIDKPAREAVPIIDSGIYVLMVDQFQNDPRGVSEVAQDLGLSLLEPHSAATVFGGEILKMNSARAVAETMFGVPRNHGAAARRVARRG